MTTGGDAQDREQSEAERGEPAAPCPGQSRGWLWFYVALWLAAAGALMTGIHPLRGEAGRLAGMTAGVLAGHDTLTHDYPAAWWGWGQIRTTGQIPLWNPSWFAGMPFVASQTFMPFYPPNWLGALLPWPLAFNIQYPLHLLLAAGVMAWTCRRRGMSWYAAGFAGLAWGFGGHLATLVGPGHIQKLQALAWLPLVVWGAGQLARGGRWSELRGGVWATGLGLALQITAGHLQIVYLTVLASFAEVGVVWGSLFFKSGSLSGSGSESNPASFSTSLSPASHSSHMSHPSHHTISRIPRSLVFAALAGILAFALSAVFLIPTLEFAGQSNRQGKFSFEEAARSSLNPEEAFEFILPRLRGDSMPAGRGMYLPGGDGSTASQERLVSDYVGAGVLFFALWGLVAGRGVRGRVALYLILAVFGLLMSLGKYLPWFYGFLYDWLPGIGHFRSPWTSAALLAYGMVMAAAWGADGFLRNRPDRNSRGWMWEGMVGGFIGFPILIIVMVMGIGWSLVDISPMNQAEAAVMLIKKACAQTAVWMCVIVFVIAVSRACHPEKASHRIAAGLMLLLIPLTAAVDLTANARVFWNAEPEAGLRQFLTRWPGFEQHWQDAPQPVRFIEPGNELSNRALTLSDYGHGRLISSAHGYHPVAYGVYFDRVEASGGFLDPSLMRDFALNWLILPSGIDPPEGFRPVASDGRKILHYHGGYPYMQPIEPLKNGETYAAKPVAPGEVELEVQVRDVEDTEWRNFKIAEHNVIGWKVRSNSPNRVWLSDVTEQYSNLQVNLQAFRDNRYMINLRWDPISQRLGLYITCLALAGIGFWAGTTARRRSGA